MEMLRLQTQAWVSVASSVAFAVLNMGTAACFVLESLFGLGLPSEAENDWWFMICLAVVAWTELLVLLALCNGCTLLATAHCTSADSAVPLKTMVGFARCLRRVGTFSLLRFLCVPTKVAYWYNNSDFFGDAVFNNPLSRLSKRDNPKIDMKGLYVQFSPTISSHRRALRESHPYAYPVILVGWLCLYVGLPLAVVWCIVFSVPAAGLKMASMPRNFKFDTWQWHAWYKFLGVLNQFAAIWDTHEVEEIAVLRFITMARCDFSEDKEEDVRGALGISCGKEQHGKVWCLELQQSMFQELDWWRGVSMLAVLDSGAMGKILNMGFGDGRVNQPFDPLNRPGTVRDHVFQKSSVSRLSPANTAAGVSVVDLKEPIGPSDTD